MDKKKMNKSVRKEILVVFVTINLFGLGFSFLWEKIGILNLIPIY
jgi:hypothetical protein